MAEALKTFPADVGRICVPQNVYTMIMVAYCGRGLAWQVGQTRTIDFGGRADGSPGMVTLTPCAGLVLACIDFTIWAFQAGNSQQGEGEAGAVVAAEGAAAAGVQLW